MSEAIAYDEDEARALLESIRNGDQAAFERFYRMLSRRVMAYLLRSVDDNGQAEEIMMDTLYEVWNSAEKFRGDAKVSTWVLGIARFKMLMSLRSARGKQHEDIDEFAEVIESDSPDGFAELDEKQRIEVLLKCMEGLTDQHRECLHLLHFEDCSVADIAQMLEIPPGTVKSRLANARSRLSACVQTRIA